MRPVFVALSAIFALVASTFVIVPVATAAEATSPAEQAADWIEAELQANGWVLFGAYPGQTVADRYSETIDAAIALQKVGGHDPAVAQIIDQLESSVEVAGIDNFVQPSVFQTEEPFGLVGQAFYTGRVAKTAAFISRPEQSEFDVRNFGGVDLIDELVDGILTEDPVEGRVADRFVDGNPADNVDFELNDDTASVIDQGWAVEALKRADEDPANAGDAALATATDRAIGFLEKQQCAYLPFDGSGGHFRAKFTLGKGNIEQGCQPNEFTGLPDNLTTASVVLSLQAIAPADRGARVTTMIDEAILYLIGEQRDNGRFSQVTRVAENVDVDQEAIATALAGLALAQAGKATEARNAAAWLRGLQVFDPQPCTGMPLDARGAVAPTKQELVVRKDSALGGLFPWRDSTAKSLPLLQLAPRVAGPPLISGPTGFVHSGTRLNLTVSRMDDGERLCIYGLKLTKFLLVKEPSLSVPIVAPAGSANRVYTVASMDGSRNFVLRVLDKKTLTVKVKKKVKSKKKQTVTISGLAPGESVVAKIKGKAVAKGTANSRGVFKKKFKVKSKKGKVTVKVWGQFKDRFGAAKFTVR